MTVETQIVENRNANFFPGNIKTLFRGIQAYHPGAVPRILDYGGDGQRSDRKLMSECGRETFWLLLGKFQYPQQPRTRNPPVRKINKFFTSQNTIQFCAETKLFTAINIGYLQNIKMAHVMNMLIKGKKEKFPLLKAEVNPGHWNQLDNQDQSAQTNSANHFNRSMLPLVAIVGGLLVLVFSTMTGFIDSSNTRLKFLSIIQYNRLIQTPYWILFSSCYIGQDLKITLPTVCKEIHRLGDWTKSMWIWDIDQYQPGSNLAIPELQANDFSYEYIRKISNNFQLPIVIRGLFNDSEAVKKWNADYFQQNYGNETLITVTEGRVEKQYENTDNTANGYAYQRLMRVCKMPLKKALEHMKQGEKFYISNIDTIFRKNNELLDHLEFKERIKPWAYNPYSPMAAQLFLGYGSNDTKESTGTMFHAAHNANFFVQVHGTKHWRFILPEHSALVNPLLARFAPAAKVAKKPEGVPMMHVSLHPGDCLLNPPYMWHEVVNGEGLVIGVATRDMHPTWISRNNMLFQALTEFKVIPAAAKMMIPENEKVTRALASIPYLTFTLSYIRESFLGPQPHPFFRAEYNPCDEHDPLQCSSTVLDKNVYGDDQHPIDACIF